MICSRLLEDNAICTLSGRTRKHVGGEGRSWRGNIFDRKSTRFEEEKNTKFNGEISIMVRRHLGSNSANSKSQE